MTSEEEIRDGVRSVVMTILELEPDELDDDADFDSLGADSLLRMEILSSLGKRFGVRPTLEQEARMNSVSNAVGVLRAVAPG
jgi:acyl carrier protein